MKLWFRNVLTICNEKLNKNLLLRYIFYKQLFSGNKEQKYYQNVDMHELPHGFFYSINLTVFIWS